MKKNIQIFSALLAVALSTVSAHAASGTWTNNASSVWSATTNWLNGTVADGTDATADFSTIAITANRTGLLDSSRTIGNLLFANTNGTSFWQLDSSGGSVLTLARSSGTPTITTATNGANNFVAVINAPLAGTAGLIKAGNGVLALGNTNSYSGSTTVSGGTLQLTNSFPANGPLLYMSFDNVSGSTVINDGSLGAAANGVLVGTNASIVAGGRYGNALLVSNGPVTSGGVFINNAVTLLHNVNNSTTVSAWTVAMWVKTTTTTNGGLLYQGGNTWASGNTRFYLAGNVNDSGGPYFGAVRNSQGWEVGQTVINDGNWHFVAMTTAPGNVKSIYVDGNLDSFSGTANNNLWSGAATGNQMWIGGAPNISDNSLGLNGMIDEVYIYNRALSQLEITNLLNTSSTPAPQNILPSATSLSVAAGTKLDLNGISATITGLSGAGIVDNTLTNAGVPQATPTLTINNSSDFSYTGFITNSASLGPVAVVKTGAGALTLTNVNGYTGNTYLNNGTLNVNHASAIGTAGTLVINGGTLDNTSGAAITVVNNKAETWSGDFTFTGTGNLLFGTGQALLSGPGTNRVITVNSNTLSVGSVNGTVGPGYGLTKQGAGILAFGSGAASTISGVLNVIGGRFQIGINDFAAGGLTGNAIVENGSATIRWLTANTPANTTNTFTGILRDGGSARLGFKKQGLGSVVLTGTNNYADTTTVENGTLRITGTNTFTAGNFGLYNVGAVGNQNGVLEIVGGTVNANKNANPSVQVGAAANARGFIKLNSGTLTSVSEIHVGQGSGAATTTPYAALTMDAGSTLTSGSYLVVGFNNDRAVLNQLGGTANVAANVMTIGAGGTGSIGVANLSGGTFGANAGIFVAERGIGILNVSGTAALSLAGVGVNVGLTGQTGWNGTVNLLGGIITANKVAKGVGTGTATFNFNGGTLKANAANATFVSGLDAAYVYSGGAVIDDGGFAITIPQTLLAPSSYGVASIPVSTGGSNYIDTPVVTITNISASGSGATAVANVSGGVITSITITSPGQGYGSGDTLGVTIFGGGGSGAAAGSPVLAANISGGLTKLGSGTLTLATGNTFTNTTKILGGTLNLVPTTLSTPGGLAISNATLALDSTSGSPYAPLDVALQSNAVVNIAFGTLSGNPTFTPINASGSLSSSGTNTINVTGSGFVVGQFPLIAYTGTPLASISNFKLGNLPPGVNAALVNNTGNHSVDLNITFIGQTLTWYGAYSDNTLNNNWATNNATNWNTGTLKYQEYGTSPNLFGDLVTFDDTLYNQQSTNVNIATTLRPSLITVNSSLPYSFTGAGSLAGTAALNQNGSGSLTLGTSNSYSGGTTVSAGTLILSNAAAIGTGALTLTGGALDSAVANLVNANNNAQNWNGDFTFAGSQSLNLGTGAVILGASRQVTVSSNTLTLGGTMTGLGMSLTKNGNGTLALTGTDNITGNHLVQQGKLTVSGSSGIAMANDILIGNGGGLAAALYQSGSTTISNVDVGGGAFQIGAAASAAGYYRMSGGTVNLAGEINIGGISGGAGTFGQLDLTGGTINIPNRNAGTYFLVNRSTTGGAVAVVNIIGGTVQVSGGGTPTTTGLNGLAVNWTSAGSADTATVTIGGGGQVLTPSLTTKMNMGVNFNGLTGNSANVAALNLNSGGLLQTLGFLNGAANNPNVNVNFNGGTLKAGISDNATFLANLGGAIVYSGGATIDDNGKAITIAQPLLAATGSGVSSIALTDGGSGYTTPPQVTISGDGMGATAYATIDPTSGAVTGIVVTSPGTNYTSASASLTGITSGNMATAGTVTLTANTSGGLTKNGNGTLTLTGASTYTGNTVINAGKLIVTSAHQATNAVSVADTATYGVTLTGAPATVTNKAITLAAGATTLSFGLGNNGNPGVPLLFCGALTNNGTLNVSVGANGSLLMVGSAIPLVHYAGGILGSLNPTIAGPRGSSMTLSNDPTGHTLYAVVNSLGGGIVWTGTNSAPGLANLWDLNSTTNWLIAGSPTTYQETVPPGDAVTFNDLGSGTVLLSNTVNPASVTISNSAVNYTFQGTGSISGSAGLTKQGSGTLTLNTANTYSGGTTLSNGTLIVGNSSSVGSGPVTLAGGTFRSSATVTMNNNISAATNTTTIWDVQGGNFTFNGNLTGGGTITRGIGATLTLYLGGDNSGFTGTYQDQVNANAVTRFNTASAGSANARWIWNQGTSTRMTLNFGDGTINWGSMTGTGFVQQGVAGTSIIQAGALGLNDTFSGVMQQFAAGDVLGLTKVGTGTMTLSGANTYTGLTTVSNGTLVITTAHAGNGDFVVNDNKTLGVVNNGGSQTALLNSLTLGDTAGPMKLFFTNVASTTIPVITVASAVTQNGTCNIAISNSLMNTGVYPLIKYGSLAGAGSFVLSSVPSGVTATLTNDPSNLWIALNVSVGNNVNTNPTNMTSVVNGSNLELSWPADHIGWRLQAQTNSLSAGLGTNWVDVPNTSTVNSYTNVINAANGSVFYRMVYP